MYAIRSYYAEATGFTLTGRNGAVTTFDQWGLPVAVTELRGERETYARDEETGLVASVSNAHGAVWNLEYDDGGAVSAIAGPRITSYNVCYTKLLRALPSPVFVRLTQFIKYLYVSHEDPEGWIRSFSRFVEGEVGVGDGKNAMDRYFDGTGFELEGEPHDD